MNIKILIHSNILSNQEKQTIVDYAKLFHYFSYHYNCKWTIFKNSEIIPWHHAVNSPVPYPLNISENVDDEDYNIVISGSNQEFNGKSINITVSDKPNIPLLHEQLEKIIETKFNHNKVHFNSPSHFYDIDVTSTWEEVFENRSKNKPTENDEVKQFGPFDFLRELEYSWALGQLDYTPGNATLDVGSLFTFVPVYLANKGLNVTSIDIDNEAVEFQKRVNEKYDFAFKTEYGDIVSTNYTSETFHQVSVISVIEHIRNNGDMLAVREIHRILKDNGKLIITTPYDHHWFHDDDGLRPNEYFQRFYNMQAIVERLVQYPLFEIIDFNFIGGDFVEHSKYENITFTNPANSSIACISLRKK